MARWQGTTTQRGYGWTHVQERERRLTQYRPGDTCAHGGEPLTWWPLTIARLYLDLPHNADRSGYLPGLACRRHNRGEGAQRSGTKGIISARPGDVHCKTCGQTYNYAARTCAICGKHYHPSGKTVRTCGRTCGRELQHRNRLATGWQPRSQRPKPPRPQREPRKPKNGWRSTAIMTWTCRYCGKLGIQRASRMSGRGLREVCDARICQLARLQVNNLVARNGVSKADADAQMAELVASAMARRRPSTGKTKVTQRDGQQ